LTSAHRKNNCPTLIAIDLGSNSFHLSVSQYLDGQLINLEQNRQLVQLARDIDPNLGITAQAQKRALTCLDDFNETISRYPNAFIKAVGTQVFREAKQVNQFLIEAENRLGQHIDIISSEQEAELSFSGVEFCHPRKESLFVIDIGGASTEFILGHGQHIDEAHSLNFGCVSLAKQFFSALTPTLERQAIDNCYRQVQKELAATVPIFSSHVWQCTVGASASMQIMLQLLTGDDTHTGPKDCIDRDQLARYINDLVNGEVLPDSIDPSLRFDVLPAGLAVLLSIMDSFELTTISVSGATITEGVMRQLLNNHAPQLLKRH